MDEMNITDVVNSDDPAVGLRAALALATGRTGGGQSRNLCTPTRKFMAAHWRGVGRNVSIGSRQVRKAHQMTNSPQATTAYHPWTTFAAAREGARSRGDRRVGTDHLLLGLLRDPEIETVMHVTLESAREAPYSLD